MKLFKTIILTLIVVLGLLNTSCEVIDVTDVDPVYQVSEDKVITNLDQAQTVLYGTYGILIDGLEYAVYAPAITSMMGLTMQPGIWGGSSENAFFNNDVSSDNFYLEAIYTKMYFLLNNANHIISKTEKLEIIETQRKNEIIAEAKALRALTHFYLLRLWGQFYDGNSEYGIVLKEQPISDASIQPRTTVQATYELILDDLDFAIDNAPDFSNTFYVSNLFAKALKSKVLLYKKDYEAAAQLALEVINSSDRTLEDTFSEIFTKKIIDTKEVLFQTPFDNLNDRNNKAFMFRSYFGLSEYYVSFLENDARKDAAIAYTSTGSVRNNKFNGSTYNGVPLTADTEYFLRLDEVYLIYAEAVLRGNDDIDQSLWAVNKVRERSTNSLLDTSDKDELLAAIREEKVFELGAESGEEWFDLVRYHIEGDIDINDYKTLSSDSKLILPLPFQTIQLSNNIIKQNPDY
ncbi:RagB/SusD family nutrient uptake outer membrane protein [Aestuariibaculum suncheonense]|uniref:RagB/SusD family nutrient uptake outer membrane protein n=1 Tax=Aestuariibaculum suncheonense TaxID=1028745 RepID=A0A8J6QUE9_9FLAO|nr:RagB/SusD family nutrient uptake outer membrane protein [Aestuariibaculum suncheonense]MBD0835659.1 RagB/SusD family nutrient uptake outer membrane protein [Aestuariibaculum suncheonense]